MRRSIVGLVAAGTLAAMAHGQCVTQFDLFASRGDSLNVELSIPLSGTFIGNHDAVDNPGGTKTLPGAFGGSTNTPIAYSATLSPGIAIELPTSKPIFTFCVSDEGGGNATVTCVELDMIRGEPSPLSIDLTISYSTFHTSQPTALFPGVSNFTLPLPAGEISLAQAIQTAPANGTLVPGKGGVLILAAIVPVEVSFEATVLDQVIEVPPTAVELPIAAELQPTLTGDYVATVTIEFPETVLEIPVPELGLVDQPFDLPTLLPPGGTAHLLVSGAFGAGSLTFGLGANLNGDGSTDGPPGDLTGDCLVNGADLTIVLGNWGNAGGEGDLNEDGAVNGADITVVLGNWS